MLSQNTCAVHVDDCNSNSSSSKCYVPCCSFSLKSLHSTSDTDTQINSLQCKPTDIITMPTRRAVKKEIDDDVGATWGSESIFDPPQHNSKSHELDSKIAASGVPASNNPLFSPLGLDDVDDSEKLSFKPSLSKDMDDDSAFSDYLEQHSLNGSPMARSPSAHDLQLGIPFPSPLDMNDKDAQIMNEALNMSFDFNENPAAIGIMNASPSGGPLGLNFPRLKPSNSSFSLNTPPRSSSQNVNRPPELKKDANSDAAFPVEGDHQAQYPTFGTPARHSSPDRTIYHVPSKSPSKLNPNSHTTPERPLSDKDEDISDESPAFIPPRSKLRTESRAQNGPFKSTNNSFNHRNDILPVKNGSSDFCVTPSPSHSQSRISKAVSDESNTPPSMMHYPPSTMHPMSYQNSAHGTPASASFPNSGEAGLPHPPSYTSPNWSNSLHLAPLPPFVSSNGAPPTPQWQHPGGAHTQANVPAPCGYQQYLPYYPPQQQMTPPRYANPQSSKESSAEGTHWRQKHHLLYQFRAKFGHCRVPPGYGAGTEYEGLFEWVMDQHYQHQRMQNGEVTTMTPTRARVLTDIGFAFSQNDHIPKLISSSNGSMERKAPSSWSNWMSQLAAYRRKHGDCDVPLKYPDNPSLGTFVNRQRTEYRKMLAKKPSSMTKEKVDQLNSLGFTWFMRESHTSWEERFEELRAYKRENGHANVPKIYSKNPSLGYWVRRFNNATFYLYPTKLTHQIDTIHSGQRAKVSISSFTKEEAFLHDSR